MKELGEKPPVTYSKYDHNPNCTLSVLEKGTSIFLRSDFSTLYNYRTSREYNTLRNGDHCSPDIRACKTWNAKKKGNQHRNSGEKEKEKSIRRQIIITTPVSAKIKGQKKGRWEMT